MPRTKRVTKRATDIKPDKNLLDQEIVQAWSNGIDRKGIHIKYLYFEIYPFAFS